jgi:hypothetical protein
MELYDEDEEEEEYEEVDEPDAWYLIFFNDCDYNIHRKLSLWKRLIDTYLWHGLDNKWMKRMANTIRINRIFLQRQNMEDDANKRRQAAITCNNILDLISRKLTLENEGG